MSSKKEEFIFQSVNKLRGVGTQLSKYLKKKNIEKIKDIILNLPYAETDRSEIYKLNQLEIGKIQSIKVKVNKINFPRIRNLPNKIICTDETGEIDIVYFNSREGYLRKLYPLNQWIIISGKINFFRNRYQITNPDYVTTLDKQDYVIKNIPKYKLTQGINEKKYRYINEQVIKNLPIINDWLSKNFLEVNNMCSWHKAIINLHSTEEGKDNSSKSYRRIVFDEILANLLTLSQNRKRVKKKKKIKNFSEEFSKKIITNLPFKLTSGQHQVINEINLDLKSDQRMFRILQGDVGSGKTIVSFITIANVMESKYQCALMGPTEILSYQHYKLAKKVFKNTKFQIRFLSGKTEIKEKKQILKDLEEGKIDLLIGTHALFQNKIKFKNLGYIVIDEQQRWKRL
jgi:ATP-dependent DNA helicase RecG